MNWFIAHKDYWWGTMNKDEGNLYVVTFEYLGAGVNVHDSNTGTAR